VARGVLHTCRNASQHDICTINLPKEIKCKDIPKHRPIVLNKALIASILGIFLQAAHRAFALELEKPSAAESTKTIWKTSPMYKKAQNHATLMTLKRPQKLQVLVARNSSRVACLSSSV